MNRCLFNRDGKQGFTLIELLVVIAIIALLLAVVMPALRKAKELAKQITGAAHQRGFGLAFLAYIEDYDGKTHFGPNYGRWYAQDSDGDMKTSVMLDADDSYAYWGIAYYPYAQDMDVFHCPNARRVDDWYVESAQDQYGWAHFGLNVFVANRIVANIKLHGEMIVMQDHVESKLDNNGDMFHIRPGDAVNLPQWRFELRGDYPEAIPECFRHSRSSWSVSPIPPHEPIGPGKSNTLWLDGHVSVIGQTTGEDIPIRWYTGGIGDGRDEPWYEGDPPY